MQELFATVAVAVFITASIGVGLRLLHLHRRTGDAPELLLGLMLLIVSGVGYPTAIAAQLAGPAAVRPLIIVSNLSLNAGSALLFAFTWRVFRAQEVWARCLAGAGVVALCAHAGWRSRRVDDPEAICTKIALALEGMISESASETAEAVFQRLGGE